jgi:hypothetical protein
MSCERPSDATSAERIKDDRNEDESAEESHIRKISNPELIDRKRLELVREIRKRWRCGLAIFEPATRVTSALKAFRKHNAAVNLIPIHQFLPPSHVIVP